MQNTLKELETAITKFIEIAQKVKLSKDVYDQGWNAKKIIAHIVFYHEYYASVIKAMASNKPLPLIDESLAVVNLRSADEYSKLPRAELLSRLKKAQSTLAQSIVKLKNDAEIPYKEGGRIYRPAEYLDVIAKHVMKHAKDLKRVKRLNKRV